MATTLHRKYGSTTEQTLTCKDAAGVVVDLTGWQEVRLSIAKEPNDASPAVKITSTSGSPDAKLGVDPVPGDVTWRPDVTQSRLVTPGDWIFELWVKIAGKEHPVTVDDGVNWFWLRVGAATHAPTP